MGRSCEAASMAGSSRLSVRMCTCLKRTGMGMGVRRSRCSHQAMPSSDGRDWQLRDHRWDRKFFNYRRLPVRAGRSALSAGDGREPGSKWRADELGTVDDDRRGGVSERWIAAEQCSVHRHQRGDDGSDGLCAGGLYDGCDAPVGALSISSADGAGDGISEYSQYRRYPEWHGPVPHPVGTVQHHAADHDQHAGESAFELRELDWAGVDGLRYVVCVDCGWVSATDGYGLGDAPDCASPHDKCRYALQSAAADLTVPAEFVGGAKRICSPGERLRFGIGERATICACDRC